MLKFYVTDWTALFVIISIQNSKVSFDGSVYKMHGIAIQRSTFQQQIKKKDKLQTTEKKMGGSEVHVAKGKKQVVNSNVFKRKNVLEKTKLWSQLSYSRK